MKTVLVTGAMGQLGKHVCKLLLARGLTVIALDLRTPASALAERELSAPGFVPAYVNLLDEAALTALMRQHQPTTIVHLAAVVSPVCYKNPRSARRVNVGGTRNLLAAASTLEHAPYFVEASSCSVYGSRNPHRNAGRVDALTPVNPIDCYGEDKVAAEKLVADSGLPHVTLRLGGIISPEAVSHSEPEYFLLLRATPRDNRLHTVDVRDAALAFANAVERGPAIQGKILLIGGDESCALLQGQVQDDVMEALGVGRFGAAAGLLGDPNDDRGWGLTDWFDTSEAQRLLDFQKHDWKQTLAWIAASQGARRAAMRALGPLLVPLMRGYFRAQQRWERRGAYADPWRLISQKYGDDVLAPTSY